MAASWLTQSGTIAVERVRLHTLVVTGGASAYGTLKVLDGRDDKADDLLTVIVAPKTTQQISLPHPVSLDNGMRVKLDNNLTGVMVVYDYD